MTVILLSVPRNGTRFTAYMIGEVIGEPLVFSHFWERNSESIQRAIDTDHPIVVPVRPDADAEESVQALQVPKAMPLLVECQRVFQRFLPQLEGRAHFIDIEKKDRQQVDSLLSDLGRSWTPKLEQFFKEWSPIGARSAPQDPRAKRATDLMRSVPVLQ